MQSAETGLRLHVSERSAMLDGLVIGREYMYRDELVVLIDFDTSLVTIAYSKDGWATGTSIDVEEFSKEAIGLDRVLSHGERRFISAQMAFGFVVRRVFALPQNGLEPQSDTNLLYVQPPIATFPRIKGEGTRPS